MEVGTDPIAELCYTQKRKNFTENERKILLLCVKNFQDIVDCKDLTSITNRKKNDAWDRITEIFNASHLVDGRASKKQLQSFYKNMKKNCRKKNIDFNKLLEMEKSWESLDSTVTLDGYEPIDKRLLQIVPLTSSTDTNNVLRTIKCEVIEDDHSDYNPCTVISNSTNSSVNSTPDKGNTSVHKVQDIIENSSNSTDCAVTFTPSEETIKKRVLDILKKATSTSCSTSPIEETDLTCTNEEQNIVEQASSSHPTSTTTSLREKMLTKYNIKRKREPASLKAAEFLQMETMARMKQKEEEHELITKKLNLEIESQMAQHKYIMERMKREDERSEMLYAAKLVALEAKRKYFERKMDAT